MIKICYLLLTLSTGEPAMINFNEVVAINQISIFGSNTTKVYFQSGIFDTPSMSIKESVEEVAAKAKQCTSLRNGNAFVYIIE